MTGRLKRYGWAVVFLALAAFAIPWFLWGDAKVVAGLPVWVWFHVGWLALTSAAFALFARRGWGVWIEGDPEVEG